MRAARERRARVAPARWSPGAAGGRPLKTAAPRAAATQSVLVVLAPAAPATVGPETRLAGLTLGRRIAFAARRAGFDTILDTPRAAQPVTGPLRVVVLPPTVVPQSAWLYRLRVSPLAGETLHLDGPAAAVIDTADPGGVLDVAARCRDLAQLAAALEPVVPVARLAGDATDRFALRGVDELAAAERWLLRSLVKPTEGFMSRHFERKVSLAVTRRLVDTRITPNAMTLVSLAIGLTGAPFFLSPAPSLQVAGAVLFLLHSILDGCDGELARLRFQESRSGALLDFWGDNVVHVAVFGCMAIGWSLAAGSPWPLLPGAVAIASSLGAAATVSRWFVSKRPVGAVGSTAARLTDALANRDFIYVVLLLAAFGRAAWFLVIAALGTPVFVLLLLLGGAVRRAR